MTSATPPVKKDIIVTTVHATTMPDKGPKHVSVPMALPCIVILVHGVNDVGETYKAQESGLCQGLNARLDRSHELDANAMADLTPASYAMPPETLAERKKEGIVNDPDAVYFRRNSARLDWSPVVPFYWGSRENGGKDSNGKRYIKKDNWHGQWTDRYGNRLDKNGAKGGGPFANATTNLNAMWGEGFNGKVANLELAARFASDPLHNLKKACPRHYMLLAAQRLAMLIKIIRSNETYQKVAINLVCHSQGCMVALVAQALLEEDGKAYAADTLILQNPPYSFEETHAEFFDGITAGNQQTTQSRIETLSNIIKYVWSKKAVAPNLIELDICHPAGRGVAGPHWQPGEGARQWAGGQAQRFTERDNRGKVYLYFCPHDHTVALMNVQGMGWNGVPDQIKTQDVTTPSMPREGMASTQGVDMKWNNTITVPVLSTLGAGFRQRVFTSRPVQPALVGAQPARYEMRSAGGIWPLTEENSPTGNRIVTEKQIARGASRDINGEELHPKIQAVLTVGEGGHKGKLGVSPIDAAVAVGAGKGGVNTNSYGMQDFREHGRRGVSPLTADELKKLEEHVPNQRKGVAAGDGDNRLRIVSVDEVGKGGIWYTCTTESPNEARARWQNDKTDDNSYHSAIPANRDHAAGVTAYDLSLGMPLQVSEEDKLYMEYLRAVADWRTNWKKMGESKETATKAVMKYYANVKPKEAIALIQANFTYYSTGILPAATSINDVAMLKKPRLIVSQTLTDRKNGHSPK